MVKDFYVLIKQRSSWKLIILLQSTSMEKAINFYFQQGNAKHQNGDYKGAIEDYNQAIKLQPDFVEAYFNRGFSKGNMQDYKGAIEDFNEAIRLRPDYAFTYNNRGFTKKKMQDYKGAIEDYNQAIRLQPDFVDAYKNRGSSKSDMQDYKGAIEDYNEAIRLKPDDANAYFNRGNCKCNMQDYKGAIQDYNQTIRLRPDDTDAYYNRGNIKNDIQDYKGSIEDYNQAIRLKPDFAFAYNNRGFSKKKMQDYKRAIEDFNEAIRLKPDYADAYYGRGLSKNDMQNYKGAIEDYNEAIKIRPDYASAYNNRGNCKNNMQDYKGAQSDYLQALRLSPQPNPLYLFNLANLYLTMNEKKEALKRYNEGVKIFQNETEQTLKRKFNLSDGNISLIQSSILIFQKLQKQAEEIRKQAQKKNRTDILQQLTKFDEAIFSACVKATEEKADPKQTDRKLLLLEEQLKQIKKRLGVVERKVGKLEAKVEQMEKRIYTEERINNMIEKIDSRKLSEFFKILYNMLINHFMAYRMLSTGFFTESVREVTTFDSVAGQVCKAQSIIESIPILGDLVGIPFKILNAFREEKSSRLNSVISDKINGSKLQSEAVITFYMSHLIEQLINNKPFNKKLAKAIQKQEKSFLNKAMEVFGDLKEKLYGKVFGGSSSEFSYVQQAVTLYMASFTLQLYEVDNDKFTQHCKNERAFSAFFIGCFEDKPKKQPKIRNNTTKEEGSSFSQLREPDNSYRQEQNQPNTCCQRFLDFFCCCWQKDSRSSRP